jgi:23S rRNA pseudouridine2604 synthase
MNVTLNGINSGGWRYLSNEEINTINKLVANSSKTEEASIIDDSED